MRLALLVCAILVSVLENVASADGLLPPPASKKFEGAPNQIVLGPIYK